MRVLLIGRTGQVGWELERSLGVLGELIALDRTRLDLGNADVIRRAIRDIRPELIVNAAAYTNVDGAEDDIATAFAINAQAPETMALEARSIGATLIHYSTDYVFDGQNANAYVESDPTAPLNAYGRSKLAGEQAIRAVGAIRDSRLLDWLERIELFLYRKAARIVSVTHSFRRNLIGRGIEAEKIHVVTNGVDLSRFKPMERDQQLAAQLGVRGKFVAGYIGTHGMAHGLETLLEAALKLRDDPEGASVVFLFLGDGAEKRALRERARALALENVLFLDTVPKEQVPRYWSLLDVAIVHLRREPLFATVIPSKLFECMGMGVPVVHGVAGESAQLVQREGFGIVFEPENAPALADAVLAFKGDRELLARCRRRALEAAPGYERAALAGEMLAVLAAATHRGHDTR